jgi:dolichol kinase
METKQTNLYQKECCRKLFHLAGIILPITAWYLPKQSLIIFGISYGLILSFELLRQNSSVFNNIFINIFGHFLRQHEMNKEKSSFIGSYYVLLGALLAVILFPNIIAITALSIMVISDTFSALIGMKYGKTKLAGKSLEGSLAFAISGFVTVLAIYYIAGLDLKFVFIGFIAVLIAAIVELYSRLIKLDDNLAIILAAGFTMQLIYYLSS